MARTKHIGFGVIGTAALVSFSISNRALAQPFCACPADVSPPAASSTTDTSCELLKRAPVFLDPNLSARCDLDQDGNGLDDEMEEQLARCFAPEFHFDSDERTACSDFMGTQTLWPCEPVLGFTAYRVPTGAPQQVRIRINYVALFTKDAGYISEGNNFCHVTDEHAGDTQLVRVDVGVGNADGWRAHIVDTSRCDSAPINGTHVAIFPSAGKHHMHYCQPGNGCYQSNPALCCYDPNRGNGVIRRPTSVFHAPLFYVPMVDSTGGWANVCTYAKTGQRVFANRLQRTSLANVGYPSYTLFTFGSGTPPRDLLEPKGEFTPDVGGLSHQGHLGSLSAERHVRPGWQRKRRRR